MKFIIPSFLLFIAAAQAATNSTDGPSCAAPKADDSYFSVVGVQGTGVHPRQELRELEKDTETWNLFLQAFARFQAMDQAEKISYFQVAGIHGVPFNSWDGVEGQGGHEKMGYCPHVSNMFGPWHRPYLALFEQVLHDRAVDIAKEYPAGEARKKAMVAASKVRLPYWDWAMDPPDSKEMSMPASLRRTTATVSFPNGTTGTIANPLYRYDFHPLQVEDFAVLSEFQFKNWNHTIRSPTDAFAADATSREDAANDRITKQQPNNRDMLYKLLTTYQPFNQVSTKASGGTIGNFETLHDGIHNSFGLGNMGIIEMSAFDPVFWFHHCNMDRIIALYQYRYPDTWVEDAKQVKGTYTTTRGDTLGPASPLAPFHMNAKGDMWTSTTSRNWTSFGYTYPELASQPSNKTLTMVLNKLYAPHARRNTTAPTLPAPSTPGGTNDTTAPGATNGTTTPQPASIDWLCEVKMPIDISISYSVRAFLGTPPSDPKKWATDPSYVGQLASMSSPRMKSDVLVTGTIALTERLTEKHATGELKSLDKETVAAYLKAHFTWRIQALDTSEISRNSPPAGLNVTIFNVPVAMPASDEEVPTWSGAQEFHHEIEGNPPAYNGTAEGETAAGAYDEAAREWVWRNGTDVVGDKGEGVGASGIATKTMHVTSVATQYVTVGGPGASSAQTPSPSVASSSASSPAADSAADPRTKTRVATAVVTQWVTVGPSASPAPSPSPSPSPLEETEEKKKAEEEARTRTKYVTSQVVQYVTVMPGQ